MLLKTLDNHPVTAADLSGASSPVSPSPQIRKIPLPLKRPLFIFLGILVLVAAVGGIAIIIPGRKILASGRRLEATARAVAPLIQSQDLEAVSGQLNKVKSDLQVLSSDYSRLSWMGFVPIARNYYLDGQSGLSATADLLDASQLTVTAIAPYADLLGLKGLSTTPDGGQTAQDRINFIVTTLDKIQPQLGRIGDKLLSAQKSLSRIDPDRYPRNIRGVPLRSRLSEGLSFINNTSSLVTQAQPLLASAPYILGTDSPRKYLVLFQNDAEIRATGGFLTGYAVISVSKGKISTIQSDDIYKLDELFPKKIPAPDPIKKYHPLVPFWYLRDQNLSPDFKVSMDTFYPNYLLTKSPTVDGVIAVDTQVLVDLLKVTGPIGVSGLGNFSADTDPRCDCPNVFYELQLLAGGEEPVVWDAVSGKIVKAPANYLNRKAFLGPMMYSVLTNVLAQPKAKLPQLVDTVFSSIQGKHILMYFVDQQVQEAAEAFNLAGRIKSPADSSDYLLVVDTNFSGAKTNIWVTYKADQQITVGSDGTVTKILTLTYSNPQAKAVKITQARNLNGLFRDWLRLYVPKGSRLLEATGFESGQATGEDLDRTVFEGFFTLAPGNTRQITFKYELPFKVTSPYQLLIQKQAGSKIFPYTLSLGGKSRPEVLLNQDTDLNYPF